MISVIICSIDEARYAAVSRTYATHLAGQEHELIRIPDARSLAEGYNRGIAQSRGDVLVFSHDDIEILNRDFVPRLRAHLERFDLVGVAGTTRLSRPSWIASGPPYIFGQVAHLSPEGKLLLFLYGAPARAAERICAMDGLFIAVKRSVLDKLQFDADNFDGFHHYDLDFTFRAFHAGFKLAVACDLHLLHHSLGNYDASWERYRGVFLSKFHRQMTLMPERQYQHALIHARTRQELAQIMEEICPGATG